MNERAMAAERVLVDLTLLNVAADVTADDEKATKLVALVRENVLSDAINAESLGLGAISTREEIQCIQQQVLSFIQPKDKYSALASMLLKSRAFYRICDVNEPKENDFERRSVVNLPRTQYKKPYIPTPRDLASMKFPKEDLWPISVSHQHPFVGIAQFREHVNQNRGDPILLGLDIVVFDDYNPRLYSDEAEFVEVFRDYFTPREWSKIQARPECRLQEFYIRWSMKEAYTKALGLGLGIDYSTIDLVLQGDHDDDNASTGIFASLRDNSASHRLAIVDDLKAGRMPSEQWGFTFLLLRDEPGRGCACVCVGPLTASENSSTMTSSFDLNVEWMTLQTLIEWHQTQSS